MTSTQHTVVVVSVAALSLSAIAAPAAAQELLPAVAFREIANMRGDNWPADFNRDGITDLVGRNADTGALQAVLGNGDGTFRAPIVSATSGYPIAVGDLNRDGRIDVLAQVGTDVAVLPGDGTGALGSPRTVFAATATFAATADMNGDGIRDVVIGEEGESLHVIAGNGDLTFQPPVTLTTGAWPHGGAIADFNADGRPDIVVAHRYGPRDVNVFRNEGGLLFTSLSLPLDRSGSDVTARDLDGDGKLDLIVSARGDGDDSDDGPWSAGFVYVYKGNGDATFGTPARFSTAPGTHSVVVGDFTRDGRLDIATSNHTFFLVDDSCSSGWKGVDNVSILPGLGGLSFGPPTSFAVWPQTYSSTRHNQLLGTLNTSDVNRDGFPDLIVGWGKILLPVAPRTNRPPTATAGADHTSEGGVLDARLLGGGSDPDGHLLTFSWSDAGASGYFGDSRAADTCYFADDYRTYTVTLTANDGHGGTASDSATLTFLRPNDPPTVHVTTPAEGEVLTVGAAYTIKWEASDFDGIREVDVSFAVNGDGQYQPIAECTNLPGTASSCTWKSPGPATERGQFLVIVTDNTGLTGGGSSVRFPIRPPGGGGGLPTGWTLTDVGAIARAGSANHDNGVFTVRGSGADIWGTADEFHWTYTTMTGDFDFTARVATVENVHQWTKAGLMIRADNFTSSAHASLFATPSTVKGVAFQRRRSTGGSSVSTAGPLVAPSVWLRLSRRGATIFASYRKAITHPWTRISSDSIVELDGPVLLGLAVSSHVDGTLATATFDNVTIHAAPRLSHRDIGAVGVAGQVSSDGVKTTIDASGADIWGTADAFRFLYTAWSGDGTVIARVRSIENTHAWAKAGVMFRESLLPNAKHVTVFVTPGKGLAMQYRSATGGTSTTAGLRTGTAPEWVRLKRTGNTFVGATSNDGVTWTTIGSVTVSMAATIYDGLAVTSHNNTTLATAVFDDLVFRR